MICKRIPGCSAAGKRMQLAGQEADLLVDLAKSLFRNIRCLHSAVTVDAFQVSLILQQTLGLFTDGTQSLDDSLANLGLECAVAHAGKLRFDFLEGLAGNCRIDAHEVCHTGLILGVKADAVLRIGVSDGTLELTLDILGTLHQEYTALGHGLTHLAVGSVQTHDTGALLGDKGLGDLEHITVNTVEALCNVTGQLAVLLLIVAHRHQVGLVQQDISCHQGRIGKQSAVDVLRILGGLVLELGHTYSQ